MFLWQSYDLGVNNIEGDFEVPDFPVVQQFYAVSVNRLDMGVEFGKTFAGDFVPDFNRLAIGFVNESWHPINLGHVLLLGKQVCNNHGLTLNQSILFVKGYFYKK
jgi:hypothetical protein